MFYSWLYSFILFCFSFLGFTQLYEEVIAIKDKVPILKDTLKPNSVHKCPF